MTDEHSVTQSVKAIFKKHGMIKTALAFAKAYWPALSIVVTAIVVGTIFVMDVKDIKAAYQAQALLNQQFSQEIVQLRADQRAEIRAINEKIDAVAKSQGETNSGLDALFKAARITVTPLPSPQPNASQKKKRP